MKSTEPTCSCSFHALLLLLLTQKIHFAESADEKNEAQGDDVVFSVKKMMADSTRRWCLRYEHMYRRLPVHRGRPLGIPTCVVLKTSTTAPIMMQ